MSAELAVLKLVCEKLDSVNIPYMLTGSFAANFFAVPRMTRDIDLVVEILEVDVNKFAGLFEGDFYFEKDALIQAIKHQSMFNIIHQNTICKIDFIIRKNIPYRQTEFQRRKRVVFDGTPIWIVSPEDLIISKLFWARGGFSQIQLKDIRNILFNAPDLDMSYIENWVTKLGLTPIFEKVYCRRLESLNLEGLRADQVQAKQSGRNEGGIESIPSRSDRPGNDRYNDLLNSNFQADGSIKVNE